MNLKELKKMIAEEYSAYTQRVKEQDMPGMGMDMDMPKIDVGADDIKVNDGDENPLDTLKAIFDMLKDFFEGDDKPAAPKAPKADNKKDDDKGDDKKDDKKDDKEDDKEEIKEGGCYGEDGKPMPESHCMEENTKSNLQERFQKLANIIK
jgi:hypothetical protein